jgi:hypothetical protein
MKYLLLLSAVLGMSTASAAVSHYGFVKGSYLMNTNATSRVDKPFFAGNTTDAEGQSLFSVAQSRYGFKLDEADGLSGKFEFDLDGATHSGATTGASLRIRQAHVGIALGENQKLTFGKKWTAFMGVLPHTYAMTKVYLFTGNTGFLVDGIDYTYNKGPIRFTAELMNSGTADVNLYSSPVMNFAFDYKMGDNKVGVALASATLAHTKVDATNEDSGASGTKLYYHGMMGALDLRFEYYMGSNLKSIHTGAMAPAAAADAEAYSESGYFLSAKYQMEKWGIFGGMGSGSYTEPEKAGVSNASANSIMTVGVDKKVGAKGTFFFEYSGYTTAYNDATDATQSESMTGSLMDIGFLYKF